jgi:putative nucleotidyltransferase with HDIG domain
MAMDAIGLLEGIIPHIAVMRGVLQGGYHHLDVWKHSLEVVHQMEEVAAELQSHARLGQYFQEEIGGGHSRLALLKLAALAHDIGKPETRKQEGDRMTFHGHEHAGERITRLMAKHLKVSVKERYFLENTVRMHLRPGYLSNFKEPTEKAIFRYMREAREEAVSIAVLAMADQRATRGPLTTAAKAKHHDRICRRLIDGYFQEQDKPVRDRLLTGHDLIKTLKLKPSPLFAEILTAVDEAQALGKISSKSQAMALAKTMCGP